MNNRELTRQMEEKHCYICKEFYEGTICGFELTGNPESDTIYDIMYRRRDVCSLDKEDVSIRKQIYSGLENEGKLLDKLPFSDKYKEDNKPKRKNKFMEL